MRRVTGALSWSGQVLAWMVLLAAAALATAGVLLPRVAGATPYSVLTGSMSPSLPTGTLVVTRPVAIEDVLVGDVITYQLQSGEDTVVTHRVLATRFGCDGALELLTQGDANPVADSAPVREVQLRGRVWYAVPHLGRATAILTGSQKQTAIYVLGSGLALYSAASFVGAAKDRRTAGRPPAHRRVTGAAAV